MTQTEIRTFAESLVAEHQAMADLVALRRAQHCNRIKDLDNYHTWVAITDRVREIQNTQNINRNG